MQTATRTVCATVYSSYAGAVTEATVGRDVISACQGKSALGGVRQYELGLLQAQLQQQMVDRHATWATKVNSEAPCRMLTSLVHIKGCNAPLVCSRGALGVEAQDISYGSTAVKASSRLDAGTAVATC